MINPSDLGIIRSPEYRKTSGITDGRVGFEGAGVVVASGGGPAASALLGKRVGFRATGVWAQVRPDCFLVVVASC